jgi:hypothetical protein
LELLTRLLLAAVVLDKHTQIEQAPQEVQIPYLVPLLQQVVVKVVRRRIDWGNGGGFGATGGSGGGGGFLGGTANGGAGTSGQGYAGGTNAGTNLNAFGGGGGAGAVGVNAASTTVAGNGGEGVFSDITGSSTQRAGVVGVV